MKPVTPLIIVADFLFPNYTGGGARIIHSFLKGLDSAAIDFKVITRPGAGIYGSTSVMDADFEKWSLAGRIIEAPPFSLKLLSALRLFSRETVLNIHHPVLGMFFSFLAPRKHIVYFFHGPWHEEYKVAGGGRIGYWIKKRIQIHLLKRADKIVVLSRYFGDIAAELAGNKNKVRVLPPIIEARAFEGEREARSELRRRWKIPEAATVLFTSRRLTNRTGVIELVKMFKTGFDENHWLIIVGKGELQKVLETEIAGEKNIRFFHYVSEESLRELLLLSDVYVLPTLALEGFGMVVLEAMDAGLPVVVSESSGGAREFIEKIDPGLVFSMQSPESLRQATVHAQATRDPGRWTGIAATFDFKIQSRFWHDLFMA